MEWKITDEYFIVQQNINNNKKYKFAGFDLDDTLIKTKSKKDFAIDENDWEWNYDNIPDKLRELYDDGYDIVIITNQAGIEKNKQIGENLKLKLGKIREILNFDFQVYCSTGKNKYRKPNTTFINDFFGGIKFSSKSFYCGDACGRQCNSKKKKDFSDTDYKFALNCGFKFITPEELFLSEKVIVPVIKYCLDKNILKTQNFNFTPKKLECIIMVGFQGSGKSTISSLISKKYNYVIINQDVLKTKAKCLKEAIKNLEDKKCIIIDSTNPSKEHRKEWIDLAKKYDYFVKVINMNTNLDLCKHNNIYRSIKKDVKLVPDIAYNMFKSKYEKPNVNENIDEIVDQDFELYDEIIVDNDYYNYYL